MPLPDPGLVLHIPMNEGAGTTAYDASRYGNDGALTGCKWVEHGLEFNGTSSYVGCGNDASLNLITGTISAWFKHAVAISGGSNPNMLSVNSGTSAGYGTLYFSSASSRAFYRLANGETVYSDSTSWDTNWHSCVVTSDGTILKMYVDGVLQAKTGNATGQILRSGSDNLYIGKALSATQFFDGSIDQPRIYNRALSAAEIKRQYNQEVHHYK